MGWWKCNCNGGIDHDNFPTGHKKGSLLNALPGRDSLEDYYNGDAPADIMYIPTAFLKKWFNGKNKPTTDQLVNLFALNEYDEIFDIIDRKQLQKLIKKTWEVIDDCYQSNWGRPTYPEERVLVCKFSFGRADLTEYWDIDEHYEYENGWLD